MICKKTGEEYEITDREIGEKIECPCCGEEYVVDWTVLPGDVYEAASLRNGSYPFVQIAVLEEIRRHLLCRHGEGTEDSYKYREYSFHHFTAYENPSILSQSPLVKSGIATGI